MARKVQVILSDDLDENLSADETVTFGLDGVNFEIDLADKHAQEMRDTLARYVHAGRKVGKVGKVARAAGTRGSRAGAPRAVAGGQTGAIREWARGRGIEISGRGRIPVTVAEAYAAAH